MSSAPAMYRGTTCRELRQELHKAGYSLTRSGDKHQQYDHPMGQRVTLPRGRKVSNSVAKAVRTIIADATAKASPPPKPIQQADQLRPLGPGPQPLPTRQEIETMIAPIPTEEHKPMTYRVAVLTTLLDMKGEPTTCSAIAKRRGLQVKAIGTILSRLKKEGHVVKVKSAGRTNGVSYEAQWVHDDFATPEQRAGSLKLGNRGPKARTGAKGANGKPIPRLVAEAVPIVLRFLTLQTKPIKSTTISNSLGLPIHRVRHALTQLKEQGKAERTGGSGTTRWATTDADAPKPTLVPEPTPDVPVAPKPTLPTELAPLPTEPTPEPPNPHAAANMSVVGRMDTLQADLQVQLDAITTKLDALKLTRELLGL